MTVTGVVCGFGARGFEKTLRKFPATAVVVVSLEHHPVAVGLKDGQDIPDEARRTALTNAGYTVKAIARTATSIADVGERVRTARP